MTTKPLIRNLLSSEWTKMLLIASLTAIAGELNITPFSGEIFRLGLGSIVFFLMILIYAPTSLLWTGFITGSIVVGFRSLRDVMLGISPFMDGLTDHAPVFLYYFLFAAGWHIVKVEKYKTSPLLLGGWAVLFELIGNGAEHTVRNLLVHQAALDLHGWAIIAGVALLRSFFTVGLYSSIAISEQQQRIEEMLGVGAELYAETLYLQKSMNHIEQITASSHDLYRKLRKENQRELGMQALAIAQEIHEVKKDSQRILAGLSKLTKQGQAKTFLLSELVEMVVSANMKYSDLLGKQCAFDSTVGTDFETDKQIPLLGIMNNLVSNAVEAIDLDGRVSIQVSEQQDGISIEVVDSGKGISADAVDLIFEPGYTTKFNEHGVAATGIGLSHVQAIVHSLGGRMEWERLPQGTRFQVILPAHGIRE